MVKITYPPRDKRFDDSSFDVATRFGIESNGARSMYLKLGSKYLSMVSQVLCLFGGETRAPVWFGVLLCAGESARGGMRCVWAAGSRPAKACVLAL